MKRLKKKSCSRENRFITSDISFHYDSRTNSTQAPQISWNIYKNIITQRARKAYLFHK